MKFILNNLQDLHKTMRLKGEDSSRFSIKICNKSFSCIFLTDINPYRLYLFTLGENPIYFEFSIDENYIPQSYIDNFSALLRYLEIKYDKNHTFKPNDFYEMLNKQLTKDIVLERVPYTYKIQIASHTREINEANKIYFCGWKTNANGKVRNYQKTLVAFGKEIADMSKKINKSSCWTDNANDERLKLLNCILC